MINQRPCFYNEEFLGANTCTGFVSLYENFLRYFKLNTDKGFVYVIKGGPGSGKSTFIKKMRDMLQYKGFDTTVLRCSGDVGSLDGVYSLSAGVAVVDGTAPHCIEPEIAGIDGTVINFGEFWNTDVLKKSKKQIEETVKKKKASYNAAYGFLGAAKKIRDVALKVHTDAIHRDIINDKIEIAIYDIIDYYGVKKGRGKKSKAFATAITSEGVSGSLEDFVGTDFGDYNVFNVKSSFGFSSDSLMRYIVDRLTASGYDTKISLCGFDGKSCEHVTVPEIKCLFTSGNDYHSVQDVAFSGEYFVDEMYSGGKTGYDFDTMLKCRLKFDELLIKAEYCLKDAAEYHQNLETYYIEAMNFELLNEYCQEILLKTEKFIDEI